jgi:FkbM family methyltransferase
MRPVYHAKITVSTKNFPQSEGRKCGVKGAALANRFSRFRVVQAAVSSSDGMLSFSGDEAWATVVKCGNQQALTMRLDTILMDVGRENPDLLRPPFALKIDIEGHEYQALLGASRFLAEHRPLVLFESIERKDGVERTKECKELLIASGYHLFMLRERLLIPKSVNDVQEALVGDFAAVPSERTDGMRERFVGFEIRQPTMEERLRWLVTLSKETDQHRRHAIRVIDTLGQRDLAFAEASADLRMDIVAAIEDGCSH